MRGIIVDELHEVFVEKLQSVTPSQNTLKLLQEIVLDKLENERKSHEVERESYEKNLKALNERKSRLIQMRVNAEISPEEFLKLKEGIENQITGLSISANETKIEELDVEAMLTFATRFISNISRHWQEIADIKQRQRLQKLVFPEGLVYDKAKKVVTPPLFRQSSQQKTPTSDVGVIWLRGPELHRRPSGYEPDEMLLLHPASLFPNF